MIAIGSIGNTELLVILGILVLLFGAAKIPQLARSMGKSISEFKKGMAEGVSEAPRQPEESAAKEEKK